MGLFDFLSGSKKKSEVKFGFAPRSPEETAAMQRFAGFAADVFAGAPRREELGATFQAVTGLAPQITAGATPFLTGAFLDPTDPTNARFLQAAIRPAERVFQEQTLPGLLSYIEKSGGLGGIRGADLIRQAYRDFLEVLADTSSRALATLGGTRVAGFQAGAAAPSAALSPVLDIVRALQGVSATEFALAPHAVQIGATERAFESPLDVILKLVAAGAVAKKGFS